jgi:hypothetical protein
MICIGALAAQPINITTITGQTYTNAEIQRVEPDSLVIMVVKGIIRVPLAELTPDLQERFHYDPKRAEEHAQKRSTSNQQAYQQARAAQQRVKQKLETQDTDEPAFPLSARDLKTSESSTFELITESQGDDSYGVAKTRRQQTKIYIMEATIANKTKQPKEFTATYGDRSVSDVAQSMNSVRIKISATSKSALKVSCDGKDKTFF